MEISSQNKILFYSGLEYLGISCPQTILDIQNSYFINHLWKLRDDIRAERRINFEKRFEIPPSLKKKELIELSKKTKKIIERLKEYTYQNPDSFLIPVELEDYILKNKEIKKQIKFFTVNKETTFNQTLTKAKQYPIPNMVEVQNKMINPCPWHSPNKKQTTPSLTYYPKNNQVYCFVCHQKKDAVDMYMIINNVTMAEAIKQIG